MNMRMNLTGLADLANAQLANKGQPLMLSLDDIQPDPDNPRNGDDDDSAAAVEAQEQLDADVAARGVKTPISVRPHPTLPRKYIINYGHRRYLSACRNRMAAIPAFVDEKFDSYDQVNENELRTGLTTRARALFIKGRLDAGDSKGEIAERLRRKNQTFVTEHLALIDAPACVNEAYAAGVTSARTLYDLRQAWQEFPAKVDAWCQSGATISRDNIRDALDGFRHDEAGASVAMDIETKDARQPDFRHDETSLSTLGSRSSVDSAVAPRQEKSEPGDVCTRNAGSIAASTSKGRDVVGMDRSMPSGPAAPVAIIEGAFVRYKGELARVVQDVVVTIVLERSGETIDVRLSELVVGV